LEAAAQPAEGGIKGYQKRAIDRSLRKHTTTLQLQYGHIWGLDAKNT